MHYESATLEQSIVQLVVSLQQAAMTPQVFAQLQQAQKQIATAAQALQERDAEIAELKEKLARVPPPPETEFPHAA